MVPEGHLDFNRQTGQGLREADPLQAERIAGADAKAGSFGTHHPLGAGPGGPALCWVLGPRGAAVGSFPGC